MFTNGMRLLFQSFLVALTTLFVCTLGGSMTFAEEHAPFHRTIQVVGTGRASAPPDIAHFETGVVTEAPTAGAALEANTASVKKLMELLKSQGIADKDLQTSRFDVSPRYVSTPQKPEPVISGYAATNQIHVRVRNLPQLGKILDACVQSGSNQLNNIRFDIDNASGLKDEARTRALSDARARAQLYAHGVEGKVGKVLSIREESHEVRPQPVFSQMRMMAADSAVPVATGEQDVEVTIYVVYELVD